MGGKVVSSGGFPRVLFLEKTDKKRPSYSHFCVFDYNLLTVGKTALILLDALNAASLFIYKNETYVNIRSRNNLGKSGVKITKWGIERAILNEIT